VTDVRFREHTDAVIAALEAVGLLVGDGEAPTEDHGHQDDGSFINYVVVYPLPGGTRSGNLDDPYGDAQLPFQVTCVGRSRRQAQWLLDEVEVILDGVTVAGRSIHPMPDSNPGVVRDDDLGKPLFYATPRYKLKTTPS
jgi:hypothetical protein